MSNTAENIQLLLADILSFHEELEKVMPKLPGCASALLKITLFWIATFAQQYTQPLFT